MDHHAKADLADTLLMIGMIAYSPVAGIYRRFMQKSELYDGPSLRWNQWAFVRAVEETLSTINLPCPADALDWMKWEHCLDDMSLLDGIEAMFPSLFRWSQVANQLTLRLIKHLTDDFSDGWQLICCLRHGVPGDDGPCRPKAKRMHCWWMLVRSKTSLQWTRILDAYPHAFVYRDLVRYYRSNGAGHAATHSYARAVLAWLQSLWSVVNSTI